ncbi:hypothetical protein CEQ90_10160 [Lewinellaceae bacterium SD302]|nr:hypothetical protein CEQ90_10160 [Lewinellaceae bacterium SD302]
MTRLFTLAALLLVALSSVSSQVAFNTTLRGQLQYSQSLNDIWGYVDQVNNIEYALVGTRTGLSIVSLEDHDNPVEVQFIEGDASTWRDMKTYGNYAYTTTDTGDDGLLIVDMSGTPGEFEFQYLNLPIAGSNEILLTAHNLYIDVPTDILYISGGNYNGGGMVLYDLKADPFNPEFIATAPNIYAHDVYVQDDVMYSSEIGLGRLAIYDVTDPSDIIELGTRITPFSFCHNAWTTADAQYIFTTDERADAPTAAYDISDPNNPILIDEFRPNRSVGEGVIPHNTHVLDGYLITSHYTDGLEIVDASVPSNLIEVGFYDTWSGGSGGFNGCWGAYPFLPSGLVLATDISNGLFVIEVDYQRAARLAGNVTDASNGNNINNVTVSVLSAEGPIAFTDASGDYQAGQVDAGTFDVVFSASGYLSQTVSVDLIQGEVADLDVVLSPLEVVAISGNVTNAFDNSPIEGATVLFEGFNGTFEATTDANGNVSLNSIFTGDYTVYAAQWGFQNEALEFTVAAGEEFSIQLEPGYRDGFVIDQGWTNQFLAETGEWTRARPVGTTNGGEQVAPGNDSENGGDLGQRAYVTGNAGGGVGDDDIDDGIVRLLSPPIDLAIYGPNASDFIFNFDYWFYNGGGGSAPDDILTISLAGGGNIVDITEYATGNPNTTSSAWVADSFRLSDFGFSADDLLQFIVTAEDTGEGHLSEAGLDNFSITAEFISSNEDFTAADLSVAVFPNPSSDLFNVSYSLPSLTDAATLKVIDLQGRQLQLFELANDVTNGTISLGGTLPAGSYSLLLEVNGEAVSTTTIIKQ